MSKIPDILKSDITFPEEVVILGPGPLGIPYWDELENYFVIALNAAINIPVKKDVWLIGDSNASLTPWFHKGIERYECMRIFSYRLIRKVHPKVSVNYGFKCVNHVDEKYERVQDRFRLTEGIPGVALDLVTRFGTKKVNLCGVDQRGKLYYDGTAARNLPDNAAYVHCHRLAKAIEMVKRDGVEVWSLSPTKLPHCKDGTGSFQQGKL